MCVTTDGVWIAEWIFLIVYSHDLELQAFTTLSLITAHGKPFPPCCVFASRSLATVSNSGYFISFTRSGSVFTATRTEHN
jgi:hypothetical protein